MSSDNSRINSSDSSDSSDSSYSSYSSDSYDSAPIYDNIDFNNITNPYKFIDDNTTDQEIISESEKLLKNSKADFSDDLNETNVRNILNNFFVYINILPNNNNNNKITSKTIFNRIKYYNDYLNKIKINNKNDTNENIINILIFLYNKYIINVIFKFIFNAENNINDNIKLSNDNGNITVKLAKESREHEYYINSNTVINTINCRIDIFILSIFQILYGINNNIILCIKNITAEYVAPPEQILLIENVINNPEYNPFFRSLEDVFEKIKNNDVPLTIGLNQKQNPPLLVEYDSKTVEYFSTIEIVDCETVKKEILQPAPAPVEAPVEEAPAPVGEAEPGTGTAVPGPGPATATAPVEEIKFVFPINSDNAKDIYLKFNNNNQEIIKNENDFTTIVSASNLNNFLSELLKFITKIKKITITINENNKNVLNDFTNVLRNHINGLYGNGTASPTIIRMLSEITILINAPPPSTTGGNKVTRKAGKPATKATKGKTAKKSGKSKKRKTIKKGRLGKSKRSKLSKSKISKISKISKKIVLV
jgi:hypothetical protein